MRNLIKVIFSGIAIGIAFLMLGYVGIYYLSGQEAFVQEIALLGEIKTLQSQMVITGISGLLIALSMYYIEKTMTKENAETYKIVLGAIFLTISSIIAMMLIETMNENIADMMVILSAIVVSTYAFINGIRTLYNDISLNKNKNIKDEKTQETEKGN